MGPNISSYEPLRNFLQSIKRPSPKLIKLPVSKKLESVFLLLSVNLVVQVLLGICVSIVLLLISSGKEIPTQNDVLELFQTMSYLELLLVGGIILPLVEEVGFRLPMIFKPIHIGISSSYLFFMIYIFCTNSSAISFSKTTIYAAIASIMVGILVTLFLSIPKISNKTKNFWEKHFIWIFYGFTVLFGLFHISNYTPLTKIVLIVSPILILPQITSGIILGYLRTKFGFFWGCLFHGLWNSILISLVYFLISFLQKQSLLYI
ncbi:MAG: CPBP family intramembrane metalloprotease [Caldisericia bacterium]|nr:CPBP family intramembrane metalloprotease [Caldisericia bacterium]